MPTYRLRALYTASQDLGIVVAESAAAAKAHAHLHFQRQVFLCEACAEGFAQVPVFIEMVALPVEEE